MDYIVFSHLRWDFVFQRPQHILSRCAKECRVFFWEEPIRPGTGRVSLNIGQRENGLTVLVPELPTGMTEQQEWVAQSMLLSELIADQRISSFVAWYYNPMAMHFTDSLSPALTVYDCMDELSAFWGAPPGLTRAESKLFEAADLVLTGGQSLYDSKRERHPSVHLFPSSIDFKHFSQARTLKGEPVDQAAISYPRFGYCGVIDERMDIELVARVADMHPEWHLVMVGPVVKVRDENLPKRPNIHYLGGKQYQELPAYLAGWDAAMMPFALNESTRFISPTKTPEYLAAGKQVVSTPIRDVVSPYGDLGLVEIAANAEEFSAALGRTLAAGSEEEEKVRLNRVDTFLARNSWDSTWKRMKQLVIDKTGQRPSSVNSGLDRNTTEQAISAD